MNIIKKEVIKFGGEYYENIPTNQAPCFYVVMPFQRYTFS